MAEVPTPDPRARRALLVKLALAGVVVTAAAVLLLRGVDPRPWLQELLAMIRGFGPVAFFAAMSVLPSLGCPLSVFTLTAGPVFGPTLGLPLVLSLAAGAIAANLALSYWLARQGLRPWIEWLFTRLGYRLPQVSAENELALTVLVRVTPGPPFVLQSFLLGLAGVAFRIYMIVSWPISTAYAIAFILFGDSLAQGKGKVALLSVSLLIALTVGVQFLRRHFARKRGLSS
jgi:uncharacterized membrane protein YdjX (TVP38/TMEM64 family)